MTDLVPIPTLLPSDATNLAGRETGRSHLSHSSITTQLNCLRRYRHHYVDRIERVERPQALTLGKAFQEAIERQDPEYGAAQLREAAMVFDQAGEDKLAVDAATVRCAAELYLKLWPGGATEQREYEYRVRLRSPWTGRYSNTFDLLGYADGIDRDRDGLLLIENKFVGQIGELNVRRLPLDRQVALACYGLWRATGEEVRKVRYRFVRKPSIRPKKGEPIAAFIERLEADYRDRGDDFYSHEETLWRSADDLVEIEAELWEWAEQLRAARRRHFYPRNTSHCADYGGCPFIPLCTGDPDAAGLYQERPRRDDFIGEPQNERKAA